MIDEILSSTTITYVGRKGVGKTFGSSILINNIENKDTLILDVTGAYTIGRLIHDAIYLEIDVHKITRANVIEILKRFKVKNKLVLNLQRLTRKELVVFFDELFKVINSLGDIAIIIDEVGEVVPQGREAYSQEVERAVRIGRNYNIRPFIMITQRAQKVDKNVLALSDYYIVMGLSHNLDLDAIQKLIGWSTNEFEPIKQKIKSLRIGEFYLIKYDGTIRKGKFNAQDQSITETTDKKRQKDVLKKLEVE